MVMYTVGYPPRLLPVSLVLPGLDTMGRSSSLASGNATALAAPVSAAVTFPANATMVPAPTPSADSATPAQPADITALSSPADATALAPSTDDSALAPAPVNATAPVSSDSAPAPAPTSVVGSAPVPSSADASAPAPSVALTAPALAPAPAHASGSVLSLGLAPAAASGNASAVARPLKVLPLMLWCQLIFLNVHNAAEKLSRTCNMWRLVCEVLHAQILVGHSHYRAHGKSFFKLLMVHGVCRVFRRPPWGWSRM